MEEKTTLLRQLIGTDLKMERFPAVSSGKTTVASTEIILSNENEYKIVATFLNREVIETYLSDCLARALYVYRFAKPNDNDNSKIKKWNQKIDRCFGMDSTEKFKLNLLFGSMKKKAEHNNDENLCTTTEMKRYNREILGQIKSQLFELNSKLNLEEEIIEEKFQDLIEVNNDFSELVSRFYSEVLKKRNILSEFGVELFERDGITYCQYKSYDREEFIRIAKILTGNHSSYHGRCLTPLVSSIRMSGNFRPYWWKKNVNVPKIVLVDGLGLSHETGNTDSISINDSMVDKFVYVSNANDLFVGEEEYFKKIRTYGLTSKLHVAITHFEDVSGEDIVDDDDKMFKVQSSLEQALKKCQ